MGSIAMDSALPRLQLQHMQEVARLQMQLQPWMLAAHPVAAATVAAPAASGAGALHTGSAFDTGPHGDTSKSSSLLTTSKSSAPSSSACGVVERGISVGLVATCLAVPVINGDGCGGGGWISSLRGLLGAVLVHISEN